MIGRPSLEEWKFWARFLYLLGVVVVVELNLVLNSTLRALIGEREESIFEFIRCSCSSIATCQRLYLSQ